MILATSRNNRKAVVLVESYVSRNVERKCSTSLSSFGRSLGEFIPDIGHGRMDTPVFQPVPIRVPDRDSR